MLLYSTDDRDAGAGSFSTGVGFITKPRVLEPCTVRLMFLC